MMMSDSFLSNAGWLFFAAWSIIVGVITFAAFGSDLLPAKAPVEGTNPPNSVGTPLSFPAKTKASR